MNYRLPYGPDPLLEDEISPPDFSRRGLTELVYAADVDPETEEDRDDESDAALDVAS